MLDSSQERGAGVATRGTAVSTDFVTMFKKCENKPPPVPIEIDHSEESS